MGFVMVRSKVRFPCGRRMFTSPAAMPVPDSRGVAGPMFALVDDTVAGVFGRKDAQQNTVQFLVFSLF